MSENNERNPLDDIPFTPDLIRGVKKDNSESDNYPGNSEQVETEDKSEQINEVLQVETERKNYQELSQDISLLTEKFKRFSQDVESNYSHLQEKVSRLSNFMLKLQKKGLNGEFDLKLLFGRVKSLENSLESLPGKIEERINSTLDSQQEIDEKNSQFTDSVELSQDVSLLREKLEQFSQDMESNYSKLQQKVSQLSSLLEELQEEKFNGDGDLESLFSRVKSLENSLESLPRKIEERIKGKIKNIFDSQRKLNERKNLTWKEYMLFTIFFIGIGGGILFLLDRLFIVIPTVIEYIDNPLTPSPSPRNTPK